MKHKFFLLAIFLLFSYSANLVFADKPDYPKNPKYNHEQDKNNTEKKKDQGDEHKKDEKPPLQPPGQDPTGVPLDGGLLALLAAGGVALYVGRKKKK